MNKSCLRLGEQNEERCKEVRKCLIGKMSIQTYGVEDRNEWGGVEGIGQWRNGSYGS